MAKKQSERIMKRNIMKEASDHFDSLHKAMEDESDIDCQIRNAEDSYDM